MDEKKEKKMTPTSHRQGGLVDLVDKIQEIIDLQHDTDLVKSSDNFETEVQYNPLVIDKMIKILRELNQFNITKIGDLYLTSGNRVVLDKGYGEYFMGGDKKLFSLEELTQGIPYAVFFKRIQERGEKDK